jgi:hypothetical protein
MAVVEQQEDKEQEVYFNFMNSLKARATKESYNTNIKLYLKFCGLTYTVFTGKGRERCGDYTYEQFTESSFQHACYLANRIGGPKGDFSLSKMDPNKANLTCNCSDCQKVKKQ